MYFAAFSAYNIVPICWLLNDVSVGFVVARLLPVAVILSELTVLPVDKEEVGVGVYGTIHLLLGGCATAGRWLLSTLNHPIECRLGHNMLSKYSTYDRQALSSVCQPLLRRLRFQFKESF